MKKYLACIYDALIKLKKIIDKYIFDRDDYQDDYQDSEELDSLITPEIDHPFNNNSQVLFFN